MSITKIDPDFTPETHDIGASSAQIKLLLFIMVVAQAKLTYQQ